MRIDIITIFPEMFEGPFNHSMIMRAQKKGLAEIHIHNLRDFSDNKHRYQAEQNHKYLLYDRLTGGFQNKAVYQPN